MKEFIFCNDSVCEADDCFDELKRFRFALKGLVRFLRKDGTLSFSKISEETGMIQKELRELYNEIGDG